MPIPEDVTRFVALVDIGRAVQDYAPYKECVRLIGVSLESFKYEDFNAEGGCETYFIDLGITDFLAQLQAGDPHQLLDSFYSDTFDAWLSINFKIGVAESTGSYAYETFTGEEPTWLVITSVSVVSGPAVNPPPIGILPSPASAPAAKWELTSFHVGQGMCALLQQKAGPTGYLLDAGAGKPVSRKHYLSKTHAGSRSFRNDLMTRQRAIGLTNLWAVLSHPDSDHWRMLDWDQLLLKAVKNIYLPSGVAALAFVSPQTIQTTRGLGSTKLAFTPGDSLELHRSQPTKTDRNSDCLVALVRCSMKTALLSGDYVYDRMRTDTCRPIVAAASGSLDGVVVPHHGDAASAHGLPIPAVPGVSRAFFSAGTHAGYGHPSVASLDAHKNAPFKVVNQQAWDDIIEQPLIP